MRNLLGIFVFLIICIQAAFPKTPPDLPAPYAWRNTMPLGDRYRVPVDTAMLNYYTTDLPSTRTIANGFTSNFGSAQLSKIFFDREGPSEFIFADPFSPYFTRPAQFDFYNTRIPYSQLSYLSGGSKVNSQNQLKAVFSGNVNKKLAIGGTADYIMSKGHYEHNATNDLSYSIFGSYISDRYEVQAMLNTLNFVVQENGGITNDAYILTPDEMVTGQQNLDAKSIPVHFTDAYTRLRGKDYFLTQRYNMGYTKTIKKDTATIEEFIPVSSIIHTLEFQDNMHRFVNKDTAQGNAFFDHTFYDIPKTNDYTYWWSLKNTVGLSLREGFHKYAKMGLAAYMTYDIRRFFVMNPDNFGVSNKRYTENRIWIGAELTKRKGTLLTYDVNGKVGLTGPAAGDIDVVGNIQTRFRILKDTVQLRAYGFFKNLEPSFYQKKYVSNHFMWNNDFDKTQRFRVGGEFSVARWGTKLNVGVENIRKYVYFNNACVPQQDNDIIQVFSATLDQHFRLGILNLQAKVAYQKSSKSSVIPLPEFSAYGNLYLLFRVVKVLQVQLGADCNYFTKYYSEAYQPATASFHVQDKVQVGNYPIMNAYANMKLHKVRFYVMYSHFNKGLFGGNNAFSLPHYPYPPSMFQLGISVNFIN